MEPAPGGATGGPAEQNNNTGNVSILNTVTPLTALQHDMDSSKMISSSLLKSESSVLASKSSNLDDGEVKKIMEECKRLHMEAQRLREENKQIRVSHRTERVGWGVGGGGCWLSSCLYPTVSRLSNTSRHQPAASQSEVFERGTTAAAGLTSSERCHHRFTGASRPVCVRWLRPRRRLQRDYSPRSQSRRDGGDVGVRTAGLHSSSEQSLEHP